MEWWYNRINHSCLSLWFVQNPTKTISSAPTHTFVGFPYKFISSVSTCLYIFGTFSWPIFKHYQMNKISLYNIVIYYVSYLRPSTLYLCTLQIMCQIGFIGTVIQWYNTRIHWNHYAMVWCKVGPTLIWSFNSCHYPGLDLDLKRFR